MSDNKFCVDYAKRQAGCKKCKQKIEKGEIRIAKITASPFSDDGEMKNYHHPACIFETFKKARATTKIIEDPSDLDGWEDVKQEDKEAIMKLIKENMKSSPTKTPDKKPAKKTTPTKKPNSAANKDAESPPASSSSSWKRDPVNPGHKVRLFDKIMLVF